MNKRFYISLIITFLVNIACVLIVMFGGKSDMCNPGPGFLFGFFIFAPMTIIGLIVSGILALVYKNKIAQGIALAEVITTGGLLFLIFFGGMIL